MTPVVASVVEKTLEGRKVAQDSVKPYVATDAQPGVGGR